MGQRGFFVTLLLPLMPLTKQGNEDYFIPKVEAEEIIKSVNEALKDWQKVAKGPGEQERDTNLFSHRFITE